MCAVCREKGCCCCCCCCVSAQLVSASQLAEQRQPLSHLLAIVASQQADGCCPALLTVVAQKNVCACVQLSSLSSCQVMLLRASCSQCSLLYQPLYKHAMAGTA